MNIKYVKEPIPEEPGCQGAYDSETKSILIRKYTRKKNRPKIIAHEMGHYYVDILFSIPRVKHYLNLLWEYIWIIFDDPKDKWKENILWYHKYYRNNAKQGKWQY